jgi:acyl-CoA thioester hydrolase
MPDPFRFSLRIYWEDTDAGGVVFYANYLKFFERARTEWLRALGFGQQQLKVDNGLMFVVTHTAVSYLQPARLDDELELTVALRHGGRASLTLAQQALRQGIVLAEGEIRIGWVEADSMKPARIPPTVLEALKQ